MARLWLWVTLCPAMAGGLSAQTGATLFSFNLTGGEAPGGLVQGIDGNLYGTTLLAGAAGYGTLFEINPTGSETTLYSFCTAALNCVKLSGSALVQAPNGDLYGTAWGGGAYNMGAVYKATPGGSVTTLHSFCAQSGCPDGSFPLAGLVRGIDGNFYGTTYYGGTNLYCNGGCGTIFKITPGGTLTTLYSFCAQSACTDGAIPAAILQAPDGNFYGTTTTGGKCVNVPCGTIFQFTPAGVLTTLHNFCGNQPGCREGGGPAGLIQANDGKYFYGTTFWGGAARAGSVFRMTPAGDLKTIFSFPCAAGACPDGREPNLTLIQATDGNLYGTTNNAGGSGSLGGTIFGITPDGTLTTLYVFCAQRCGNAGPAAGLVQATNGDFYGTIQGGGAYGDGAVFTFSQGLAPFVKPQPAFAGVGKQVQILGSNLTGATSVTFNGVAAAFEVASNSLIVATVPAGATSGQIQVVTPVDTLSSNVSFRVLP